MIKKTPLYDCHLEAKAKMVDFAGWSMPLHYGSQLHEHKVVRESAGIFDVSHMTVIDIEGKEATPYLRHLLSNNVDNLVPHKAFYTCMLNEHGGIIDDLIVYKKNENQYRLVVNSATRDKDLAWINKQAAFFEVKWIEPAGLAMLAIQGPDVVEKLISIFPQEINESLNTLKFFHWMEYKDLFVARTGYTGEDGFEIILPASQALLFWKKAMNADIKPCGLGARDTLRLEAGLNLYGADMDETVTPLESNIDWTVAWEPSDRNFIGRKALDAQKRNGVKKRLVGLLLEGQGVLRNHQKVYVEGVGEGEITSGTFSPTLNKGIALARVPVETDQFCRVDIRGKQMVAQVVRPPFVKQGKKIFACSR